MRAALFCVVSSFLFQACGAGSTPRSEGIFASIQTPGRPSASPTPPSTPVVPNTPVSGRTCLSSDPNKLCLGIHLVAFKDAAGTPITTLSAVEGTILNVNQIWSSCNIGFQIDQFDAVDPVRYSLPYNVSRSETFLSQFTNVFHSPSQVVVGISGPWSDNYLGWSFISTGPNQMLGLVLNPRGITQLNTLAHELGHYIGLDHVSDSNNIMALFDNHGTQLPNADQCQYVRANIPVSLAQSLRH